MRALAYLENCDALEGDSEYAAMEEYFKQIAEGNASLMTNFTDFTEKQLFEASNILRYIAEGRMTPIARDYFGTLEYLEASNLNDVRAISKDGIVLAINPDFNALDLWITTPLLEEGFLSDLLAQDKLYGDDLDYLLEYREYFTADDMEALNLV